MAVLNVTKLRWAIVVSSLLGAGPSAGPTSPSTQTIVADRRVGLVGLARQNDPTHWWNAEGQPLAPHPEAQSKQADHAWLGVQVTPVSESSALVKTLGYTSKDGLLVQSALPDSPADGALQAGDIITKIDGKPVNNVPILINLIAAGAPGSEITVSVFRDHKMQDINLTLARHPQFDGIFILRSSKEIDTYRLLLRIEPWNPDDAVTCEIGPAPTARSAAQVSLHNGSAAVEVGFAARQDLEQIDLYVGIAAGAWTTSAQSARPAQGLVQHLADGTSIRFKPVFKNAALDSSPAPTPPRDSPDATVARAYVRSPTTTREFLADIEDRNLAASVIEVTQTFKGTARTDDVRLLALVGGKEMVAARVMSIIEKRRRTDRFELTGVDPADIDGMLLQSRTYQRVTLPGVPLRRKRQ